MRRLLGIPTLIVRDERGVAKATSDRCPHRFAPLHKGVFDGRMIECPCHGFKVDLNDKCGHHPHGDRRIPRAARVKSYPVQARDDVIWI